VTPRSQILLTAPSVPTALPNSDPVPTIVNRKSEIENSAMNRSHVLSLLGRLASTPLLLRADCGHLVPALVRTILDPAAATHPPFGPLAQTPSEAAARRRAAPSGKAVSPLPKADPAIDDDQDEEPYVTPWDLAETPAILPGGLAIVQIRGVLCAGIEDACTAWCYGLCRPEAIQSQCYALAAMPEVSLVLFSVDSPGGYTTAIDETAQVIRQLGTLKATVAFSDGMICSAAYWLASQCAKIVATPSATIGCIGTYATVYDYSAMFEEAGIKAHLIAAGDLKGQGAIGVPIKKEFLQFVQANVDAINAQFLAACRAGRGALAAADLQGQWFSGAVAVEKNLADATCLNRTEFLAALQAPLSALF